MRLYEYIFLYIFLLVYSLALECPLGFYDTSYGECRNCKYLRNQYWDEDCCAMASILSMPAQTEEIATYKGHAFRLKYNPPRPICNHLWEQWGNCTVCQAFSPGHYCSMDVDCNNTNSCKGFCCITNDANCASCENNTGYCTSCAFETVFNATGDMTCQRCTSNYYYDSLNCHLLTDCLPGTYVSTYPDYTTDRVCSNIPPGYYSTETNADAIDILPWTTCDTSIYYTVLGGTTYDSVCEDRTICYPGTYVVDDGDVTTDRVCANCTTGTTNSTNMYNCT